MNLNELYENREKYFLTPSSGLKNAATIFLVLGACAAGYGFYSGKGTQVWGSYIFNLYFFFGLAVGGIAFSAIQDVVGAIWSRPIRRIHEGFGAFIFVGIVLIFIFLLAIAFDVGGAGSIYLWMTNPELLDHFWGKKTWLQPWFFYLRIVLILVFFAIYSVWILRSALRRDQEFLNGNKEKALAMGHEIRVRNRYWGGGLLLVFGYGLTFLGMDLIKSLAPLWFSTLWGGWQFAIMMQTLFASTLLVMFWQKKTAIGAMFNRQQFHDVGKLMHGFTAFFGYLTFAHVLTYWYANMPETTEYYIHRLHSPWIAVVIAIPILAFVLPLYSLVFRAAKWTAVITIPICIVVLFGQWLSNLIVVMPEVIKEFPASPVSLIELGMFFFMLGLFMKTFFWFGRKYPMISFADPLLPKAYEHH